MRRFAPLTLCLAACTAPEVEDDGGAAGQMMADPDAAAARDPDAGGGGGPVRGPYVVVQDETEGLAVGVDGADVDVVSAECDGVAYEGRVATQADAVGEPDGEATALGLNGFVVVDLEVADLRGCTVRIYEVADRQEERYRVYACPDYAFEGDCRSLGAASDGETFEAVVE